MATPRQLAALAKARAAQRKASGQLPAISAALLHDSGHRSKIANRPRKKPVRAFARNNPMSPYRIGGYAYGKPPSNYIGHGH